MTRLGFLVGIGLMLVGACAYALPQEQEWYALLPAFAGMIIVVATDGALHSEWLLKRLVYVNGAASIFLLVYIGFRIYPDMLKAHRNHISLIADWDVLGLALIFLVLAIRKYCVETSNKPAAVPSR